MKVVAILGGLGSQMMKYAFFLSVKKSNANEKCYIDTLPFDKSKMWNGYELKKIFGIDAPDIKDIFTGNEIKKIKKSSHNSCEFVLNKIIKLESKKTIYFSRGEAKIWSYKSFKISSIKIFLSKLKRYIIKFFKKFKLDKNSSFDLSYWTKEDIYPEYYLSSDINAYYDEFNHVSDLYINDVKEDLLEVFKFPNLKDKKNLEIQSIINSTNSVSIHVRRSDHMYDNGYLYSNGYYKRAVSLIKEKTKEPIFFIFSEDSGWCKENIEELGLNLKKDTIWFIDWNRDENSYIDMQLMSCCKHNIIPISSFSWWASYLNLNKDKIICAPKGYWNNVEYHM